ncbi:hypothetical protein JJB99_25955 [Bradyrhizobium diazoefficiens]|uniref:hypothetical protein n=1 Tax=Bradyrhizobium diazoefficiens TaxID=1355477 RepID=UPI001909A2F8|nr:hypothetical protein [Bradyrhizobium diazoefficiens]QQO12859.1 hypothetical protein JJB99_25955 [Bradyrhizobium diazoefficiens]
MKLAPNRLWTIALFACWFSSGSTAWADWASCQTKPTQDCLLEEAFHADNGPLTGKDRIDVLIAGGALAHPDWATAADIAEAERLAKATTELTGIYYTMLAIHGLVAANQKQQAIDLVASLPSARQTIPINELVRQLVKAGDPEAALGLPDRMQPPLDPKVVVRTRNDITVATIRALAENGKTDRALTMIADQKYLTEATTADLQAAVGQAFAKRDEAKLAEGAFDQADKNLEAARRYSVRPAADMQFRLASVRVLALRGKVDAVNAALQEMKPSLDAAASDASVSYERSQGYQRVVAALLDAKQPEAALTLAKSLTPDATKDAAMAAVGVWYASNDRLGDARAVLSSMSSTPETSARVAVLRNVAIYSAKGGGVGSALKLVGQIQNSQNRRGTLFAIAHMLPH